VESGDWIELTDLRIACIVGVLESEQAATQPLLVDVRMYVSLESAGEAGDLTASIDYGAVADHVRMLASHGRFRLIESLAVAIVRLLLAPPVAGEQRAAVEAVEVRIRKPEILGGRAIPGVHLFRTAGRALSSFEVGPGVWADILVDLPQGGAWRVRLDAGARFSPGPDLAVAVQSGLVEASGGRTLRPGDRLARGDGELMSLGVSSLIAVGHW
jgi:dihydroneopterin aldolase